MQFLSVKRQDTLGTYINDIEKGRQDILADLKADSNFFQGTAQEWVNAQRTDIPISLDEVLNYISGALFIRILPLFGGRHLGKLNLSLQMIILNCSLICNRRFPN